VEEQMKKDGFRWIGRGIVAVYVGLFIARHEWPALATEIEDIVSGVVVLAIAAALHTIAEELESLKTKLYSLESLKGKQTDTPSGAWER
jgi:hypothetical protein